MRSGFNFMGEAAMDLSDNGYSLLYNSPFNIEIVKQSLPHMDDQSILVKTAYSAISAGTELLVYRNQFPADMEVDSSIEGLSGQFSYPLKYGYAAVGHVVQVGKDVSKDWLGKNVFCFHPHESFIVVKENELIPVPQEVNLKDAVFLANMETAVSLIMDARPMIGENVAIFGQGVVGLLTAAALSTFTGISISAIDPIAMRREISKSMGISVNVDPQNQQWADQLSAFFAKDNGDGCADLVFELSGNPAALNHALKISGMQTRIIVGSWYGTKDATIKLGEQFHRNRIKLISSQVSSIEAKYTARWTKARRLNLAWSMIKEIQPQKFISHQFHIQDAAAAFNLLDKGSQDALQIILHYDEQTKNK